MMRRRFARWQAGWLAACCLLLLAMQSLPARAQGATVLELAPGTSEASLAGATHYFHDATGAASLDAIVGAQPGARFQPLPEGGAAFGFERGAYWFRSTVINRVASEPRWLLVQRYALSDRLDLYVRYADGRIVHHAGGDSLPFSSRSIRYRHPNFLLELPPGEPVELLLRVQSQSSMQVPLDLYTPKAFTELSRDAQFAIGIYYGILLALFFYNLVLWLTLRDASYFWYLLHVTAFGLVLFTLNGLAFEYLWPGSPRIAEVSVPVSICLALVGMQQFARIFLELPTRWPRGNVASLGVIAFFVLLGVASLVLPYRIATPIASRAVLVGVLWIAIASMVVVRRGYAPARLFLLAWAMFLLGTTMFTLVAFGVLPKNFATEYGVQIGSAVEMLLLSVALGHRYAALRNENQRIVGEANLMLERKVEQRTQEVRAALVQLEDAHGRLRDSSRRDGLTGLYNRTWFHEAFEQMLAQGHANGRPVSLLMIDLDHFKAINDRHGHLVGDDCLKWAAQRIGQALRPYDALLARFGGEEFVVGLPDHDLRAAAAVAEIVRARLAEVPCESDGNSVFVSASIGVHAVPAGKVPDVSAVFKIADEALYMAKGQGRDCVRTVPTTA